MPSFRITALSAVAATAILAGCTRSSAPEVPSDAVGAPGAASSVALPGDHASTPRYAIAIDYPAPAPGAEPLQQALRAHAAQAKREFMQALPDPQRFPQFATRQLQLLINYQVAASSPEFISVRGTGMMDTGGAHPIPLDATFVFDRQAQRIITLDDLFEDPVAARATLAEFARTALEQRLLAKAPGSDEATPEARRDWEANMRSMIQDGTQPTAGDFAEFLVGPDGLTLVFPPYQVAPYVYGAQTVEVPLAVFVQALKPRYQTAFGPAH